MKQYILFLIAIIAYPFTLHAAPTRLYAMGSAVPSGCEQLQAFPDGTFHFHGALQPGDLYITTVNSLRSSTQCYAPSYEASNIVNNGVPYTQKRGLTDTSWKVAFSADNYRFKVDVNSSIVKGEIFEPWYEAWIVGGCVAPGQTDDWYLEKGQQMSPSYDTPYEFVWAGLLKNYTDNMESKRFKILGQYGWDPKHLNPFSQDCSVLNQEYVCYNNSHDYKWNLASDGYYRITVNVFLETIRAEYLGKDCPDGVQLSSADQPSVSVSGSRVNVNCPFSSTVQLLTVDGHLCDAGVGYSVSLTAPASGLYIVRVGNSYTRKLIVR